MRLRAAALTTVLFAGLAGLLWAQSVGSSCSAGQVSGPDSLGNNLICSGGVFVAAGGYGGGGSSATDRISTTSVASGANLGMVVADQGTISFTTGGVAGTSYLDTTGRWVGPGISVTTSNGISSTNGYFTGNVGIGTSSPARPLDISGSARVANSVDSGVSFLVAGPTKALRIGTTSTGAIFEGVDNTGVGSYQPLTFGGSDLRFFISGIERARMNSSGNVGIGTTAPQATLQVSGSFIVSQTGQTTTPSLYISATSGYAGIGTNDPSRTLHVVSSNGGMRLSHSSGANGYFADFFVNNGAPFYIEVNAYGRPIGIKSFSNSGFNQAASYISGYYGVAFATAATDPATSNLKMVILQSGNVGIGTTTPSGTLSVSGTVAMSRYSAQPIACGATYTGLIAMTSAAKLCVCDGAAWNEMNSAVACSW